MSKQWTTDELNSMAEVDAIEATEGMDEHPEDYSGACMCNLCVSYGDLEPEEPTDE